MSIEDCNDRAHWDMQCFEPAGHPGMHYDGHIVWMGGEKPEDDDLGHALAVIALLPAMLADERARRRLSYRMWQQECGISASYLYKMSTDDDAQPSVWTAVRLIVWLRKSRQIDMNDVPAVYLRGDPHLAFDVNGETVVTKSVPHPQE